MHACSSEAPTKLQEIGYLSTASKTVKHLRSPIHAEFTTTRTKFNKKDGHEMQDDQEPTRFFAEERCSKGMKDLARGRTTRHRTTHARAYELRVMLARTASCCRQNLGPNGPSSFTPTGHLFCIIYLFYKKRESKMNLKSKSLADCICTSIYLQKKHKIVN